MTLDTALVSLAVTLLGTLVLTTWRSSSLATRLLEAVKRGEERDTKIEERLRNLDAIPQITVRLEHMEKNHSLIPRMMARLEVLEAKAEFSKEMRQVRLRQSRPDDEE